MTAMKLTVLSFLHEIPKGKVTTYKALAEKFKTHPRAIATYMRTNKEIDTYPCYKVVGTDGWLRGYIAGLPEKVKRLENDGVKINNDRVLPEYILMKL